MGESKGVKPKAKASQTRRSRLHLGKYYLVTLRWNRKEFISCEALMGKFINVLEYLAKYGTEWSDNIGFELTKGNVLHLHTYCYCQTAPWYKSSEGWNVNFKEFPECDTRYVIDYIKKCDQSKPAIQQRETVSRLYNTHIESMFV